MLTLIDITLNHSFRTAIIATSRELKDLLTSSPKEGDIDESIKVINGIAQYSEVQLKLIEASFDKLKNDIVKFQFVINRA